jgi:two-component system heavy metal sensor histidine kinase CusS
MTQIFPMNILTRLPIRWRLSLWYGAVLAVILAGFGGAIYGMMRTYLQQRTDAALFDELMEVQDEIEHAPADQRHERLVRRFGDDANNEYQVVDSHGSVTFRSRRLGAQALPIPQSLDSSSGELETILLHGDQRWRVASRLIRVQPSNLIAQVAVSLEPDQASLRNLLRIMLIAGPIALGGALAGGYFLARQALAPVDRMVATASEITATRLDRRLNIGPNADELSRLATALNKMIERLDQSFRDMQRFAGDAAHELRTPLAIIRNAADVSLVDPKTPQQCRPAFEDILEEAEHLGRLADELLYLTRQDSGIVTKAFAPLRLDLLVADAVEHLRLVAEDNGITIQGGPWNPCVVNGDSDQLRRLVLNVLDNAIKFTPAGGRIVVDVAANDERAFMSIKDSGIGIAAEHLPHIFERFYRVDSARNGESGGAGLGLAICKAIVHTHEGEIVADSSPGCGTCIRVQLSRMASK